MSSSEGNFWFKNTTNTKVFPVFVKDCSYDLLDPRKHQKFYDQSETELRLNQAAIYQIAKYRKEHGVDQVPSIPALKKEKAALLREQERLNNQRTALKESVKGMSEAYRAIEEQTRQRGRQQIRGRNDMSL